MSTGGPSATGASSGTAATPGAPALGVTPNQAMMAIQAQGFTDVRGLQRVGNTYTATASQNGQTKQVRIDANTGSMMLQ